MDNQNDSNSLGKLLYYTVGNVLIGWQEFEDACGNAGIPCNIGNRRGFTASFRNATDEVRERREIEDNGRLRIFILYFRDSRPKKYLYSRELVKEELCTDTNRYTKLGSLWYDKRAHCTGMDNLVDDPLFDAAQYCRKAERLFSLYQSRIGRQQVSSVMRNYLRSMDCIKLQEHGNIYFVPHPNAEQADRLEEFAAVLNQINQNPRSSVSVNSVQIISEEKQRIKIAAAFSREALPEARQYAERANYLIQTNSPSPSIMERWFRKISRFQEKKDLYAGLLQAEFYDLDAEISTLKMLSQELRSRADQIRREKTA